MKDLRKISENKNTPTLNLLPLRFFVAVLCVTSFFLIIIGWFSWETYRNQRTTTPKIVRLQELIGVIKTTDEILTMSARMAAATEDLKWERRYLTYEPVLDRAIKEAMDILPDRELSDSISKTDAANTALVKMEKASFELVRKHRKDKAAELLFSDQYERQKKTYSEGTKEALKYISTHIEETIAVKQKQALLSFIFVSAVLIIYIAAWIFVLKLTGSYLSEQIRVKEKLRQSRGFLDSIIENLPSTVFIKDSGELRYILINKAGEELMECTRENIIGKNASEFLPEATAKTFNLNDREVLDKGRLMDIPEQSFQTFRHGERILHTKKIPLFNESGEPEYLLGISEDITERKRVEAELKDLEEERIKAQKLESVGILAGGIAHDFNNLLHRIFGYITLAKKLKDNPDEFTAMLDEVEEALNAATNLTNQLLTFSKGGKPLKETISLYPLLERAARFTLSGLQTDYRIKTDPDLWNINADSEQINQVLQNIIINAQQAMNNKGTVDIEARNIQYPSSGLPVELKEGKYVEISVTDTGVGIPEIDMEMIFDPYFTTKDNGSGLGLASSYSIIKNHDGIIDVTSKPGKGSAFRIYLPATKEISVVKQTEAVSIEKTDRGRILVMDDEESILNLATKSIRAIGHDAETARNGTEAIEKYKKAMDEKRPFDIVILDLTIRGGLGGLETVKKLIEIDKDVKAVISSGYSDNTAISSYKENGFTAVLKKPYTIIELRDTLNKLMG